MERRKKIIGRTDRADFSEFNLKGIDVKVDTGAYTSSIHCVDIQEVDQQLFCVFLDNSHPEFNAKKQVFRNYDITAVKSSNGQVEIRYTIRSKITLFNKNFPITLTLTSRDDMRFPVLLGRKFLNGKFLVDTQLENVSYNKFIE